MEQVSCSACGGANDAGSSFCRHCGGAITPPAATTPDVAGPSGWAMATSGIDQPAPVMPRAVDGFRPDQYAGWWNRAIAACIDGLIYMAFVVIAFGGALAVAFATVGTSFEENYDATGPGGDDEYVVLAVMALMVLAFIVFWIVWEGLWYSSRHMGTPGQLACGFRVTDAQGRRISRARGFSRAGSKMLMTVILGWIAWIVDAFTIGLTQKRQALHDMMAGTICVTRATVVGWSPVTAASSTWPAAPAPPAPPAPASTSPLNVPPPSLPPHAGPFS